MKGRRPSNETVPSPTSKLGVAPKWLPAAAKAEWKRVVSELQKMGANLSGLDETPLVNYTLAMATIQRASADIDRFGVTIAYEDGRLEKNPATTVLSQAQTQARNWGIELGLTPASKGKIPMAKATERVSKFKAI